MPFKTQPNIPERPEGLPHLEHRTMKGVSPLESVTKAGLQYPDYIPFKLPNLEEQPYHDPPALLGAASSVIHLTPDIGTELVGLQLKNLNDVQKNELGRLVAERGVVFLREQDLDAYEKIEPLRPDCSPLLSYSAINNPLINAYCAALDRHIR